MLTAVSKYKLTLEQKRALTIATPTWFFSKTEGGFSGVEANRYGGRILLLTKRNPSINNILSTLYQNVEVVVGILFMLLGPMCLEAWSCRAYYPGLLNWSPWTSVTPSMGHATPGINTFVDLLCFMKTFGGAAYSALPSQRDWLEGFSFLTAKKKKKRTFLVGLVATRTLYNFLTDCEEYVWQKLLYPLRKNGGCGCWKKEQCMTVAYCAAKNGVRVADLPPGVQSACEQGLADKKNKMHALLAFFRQQDPGRSTSTTLIDVTASFGALYSRTWRAVWQGAALDSSVVSWANAFLLALGGAWAPYKLRGVSRVRKGKGSINEGTANATFQDYAGLRVDVVAVYVPIVNIWLAGYVPFIVVMFQPVVIISGDSDSAPRLESSRVTYEDLCGFLGAMVAFEGGERNKEALRAAEKEGGLIYQRHLKKFGKGNKKKKDQLLQSLRLTIALQGIYTMNAFFPQEVRFGNNNKMLLAPPNFGTEVGPVVPVHFDGQKITTKNFDRRPLTQRMTKARNFGGTKKWMEMKRVPCVCERVAVSNEWILNPSAGLPNKKRKLMFGPGRSSGGRSKCPGRRPNSSHETGCSFLASRAQLESDPKRKKK